MKLHRWLWREFCSSVGSLWTATCTFSWIRALLLQLFAFHGWVTLQPSYFSASEYGHFRFFILRRSNLIIFRFHFQYAERKREKTRKTPAQAWTDKRSSMKALRGVFLRTSPVEGLSVFGRFWSTEWFRLIQPFPSDAKKKRVNVFKFLSHTMSYVLHFPIFWSACTSHAEPWA